MASRSVRLAFAHFLHFQYSIVVQHPHLRHQSASWHQSKNYCLLLSTWIETCTSSDTPVHTKWINQELPSSTTSANRH